jgi:ribosomal protein S14
MTTSDSKKVVKQLKHKPAKMIKFKKYNTPKTRSCGRKKCTMCGRTGVGGMINSYGLKLCRCCFRANAKELGFKKYS